MRSWFLFFLLAVGASGTQVFGVIYDERLEPVSKALVTVNTTPEQVLVSNNGSYEFFLPAGTYQILALTGNKTLVENLAVPTEGSFRIDLIFLPSLPEDISSLSEIFEGDDIPTGEMAPPANKDTFPSWAWAAVIIFLGMTAYWFWKQHTLSKRPREQKTTTRRHSQTVTSAPPIHSAVSKPLTLDQQKVLRTLESFNNRASQKELRKALGEWSEAKVSLELTELEDVGLIRKIKKGRGNIIRRG